MCEKNAFYMESHVFLMLFMYLFLSHRFSKRKTVGICAFSFLTLCAMDVLKLSIYPDSRLCYFFVTIFQIVVTQSTGLLISKRRDSKALFVGLSASNYVIAGSITATVMHIWTADVLVALAGSLVMHASLILLLYDRIRDIWLGFQEKEAMKGWWELCLIPVFFYCSFSCLAYFPYTLDDHPENILGVLLFIITMFISYVIVFRYLSSESQRSGIYWKNVLFEFYIKELEDQYQLIERSEKNLRILRHDMRHYSGMIDLLLEQGEYDEIKKVTAHINTVVDDNKVAKYCENLVVNTMLSCMMEKAASMEVAVRQDIIIPKEFPANDYELAMVVANLFENALDCVKDFPNEKKVIDLKIRCGEDYLLIHMKNRYEKEICFDPDTGLPKSRKGEDHGLGMQSVQAFSDKIGGNIGCYCEDDLFHIMLFAKF